MKLLRTILLMLTLLPLTACGLSSEPIEGQILEAGTKKPLAGAIVVVRWEGTYSQIAESKTSCYHVETAATDGEGRYKIPGWWQMTKGPFFSPGAKDITAYKPGYAEHWPAGYERTEDYKKNVRYLAPFKGTSGERLEYLKRLDEGSTCPDAGDSRKNRLQLQESIYNEARMVAITEQDRRIVEIMLFGIESERFGSMEALKRMDERRVGRRQ